MRISNELTPYAKPVARVISSVSRSQALENEKLNESSTLAAIGTAYKNKGEYGRAINFYSRALALQETEFGKHDRSTLGTVPFHVRCYSVLHGVLLRSSLGTLRSSLGTFRFYVYAPVMCPKLCQMSFFDVRMCTHVGCSSRVVHRREIFLLCPLTKRHILCSSKYRLTLSPRRYTDGSRKRPHAAGKLRRSR